MVKETLLSVLNGGSPAIVAIFLSYLFCWASLVVSCFVINQKKVSIKQKIPWIFFGALYSVIAQAFFPFFPCILGASLILFICLKIEGIKSAQALSSLLVVLISGIVSSLPFASYVGKLDQTWAVILGSICESIGPMFISAVIKICSKR